MPAALQAPRRRLCQLECSVFTVVLLRSSSSANDSPAVMASEKDMTRCGCFRDSAPLLSLLFVLADVYRMLDEASPPLQLPVACGGELRRALLEGARRVTGRYRRLRRALTVGARRVACRLPHALV